LIANLETWHYPAFSGNVKDAHHSR
jgi:hypothetical protein